MLIRFTVENFLSFKDRVDFSMLASPEKRHSHHLVPGESESDFNLLRTSVIYGANASGKSNLIRAMNFARKLIVEGVDKNKKIPVIPFRLDKTCSQKPSRFEFEFRFAKIQFAYGFSIDSTKVHEEWLFEISHQGETPIFERVGSDITFNFDHVLFSTASDGDRKRIGYEADSTRKNLLFLTNSEERNITWLEVVYGWFQTFLRIIFPTSERNSVLTLSQSNKELYDQILNVFDLGVSRTNFEAFDMQDENYHTDFEDKFHTALSYGRNLSKVSPKLAMFDDIKGENPLKLSTIHRDKDGNEVLFDFLEESDGTQRIMDIVPFLFSIHKYEGMVYVIDEIENSLHTLLIRKLFDLILNHEVLKQSASQLIASTHEVYLLDVKNLFRKDEIWFMEKNQYGESHLYSLANTDVEDLDLVNGYLKGRFGAIPFLKDINELGWKE